MKRCTKCYTIKNEREFYPDSRNKKHFRPSCKVCCSIENKNYRHTFNGLVNEIYKKQKISKYAITYSKKELSDWIISQYNFNDLFNNWKISNFNKWLKPSVDRIDDNYYYSFDNIQLITLNENFTKGNECRSDGRNKKTYQPVIQMLMSGFEIKSFYSIKLASEKTGIDPTCISRACTGVRNTIQAGGFKWKHKQ